MKKWAAYILLFFTSFWLNPCLANDRLDSLKAKLENTTGLARIDLLNEISEAYLNQNTERSLYYAKEALSYSSNFEDPQRVTTSMLNVGVVLRNIGESEEALKLFVDALAIAKANRLHAIRADILHKIGVTYLLVNDFISAKEYAEQEKDIWEQLSDKEGLASAYNFEGLIYINLGKYEVAQDLLEQSVAMAMQLNDEALLYKPLVNLGDLYLQLEQPQKALSYIRRSIEISSLQNNKFGLTIGNLNLGEAYFLMELFDESVNYTVLALKHAEEIHSLSLVRNCYRLFAKIYETNKNYESALYYNKLYISTEDSMLSEVTKRKIAELELKYDMELKQQEIEELKKRQKYQQLQNWLVAISVVLISVVSYVAFSQRKAKRSSQEQKLKIDETNLKLEAEKKHLINFLEQAKGIKSSLIPVNASFFNIFNDFFVSSQPQNITGSDFYWYTLKGDQLIIVVGDCPGKGMEKAMHSVFCTALIAQIISENALQPPADLLKRMHERLQASIANRDEANALSEGIDMCVAYINIETKRMLYASAGITLHLFYQKHLQLFQPEDFKLGIAGSLNNKVFQNKTISLQKHDKLLLFTNGVANQVNSDGEALGSNRLKNLLADHAETPLGEVKEALEKLLKKWRRNAPASPDTLIFGLEI